MKVVLAETAWTALKEEEHKEQGKRERVATHKTSRLVVPLRSGNSLMSVAPLSDLQRNEDEVRWTEDLEASAAAQGPTPISQSGKSVSSRSADAVSQSWAFLCKEAWQAQNLPQPLTFLA